MSKTSAITMAGGLVVALMAGMVGVTRQAGQTPPARVVVVAVPGAHSPAPQPIDVESERD